MRKLLYYAFMGSALATRIVCNPTVEFTTPEDSQALPISSQELRRTRSLMCLAHPAWITDKTPFERDLLLYYPEHGWVCRTLQESHLSTLLSSLKVILRLLGERSSRWFYTVDKPELYKENLVIQDLVAECAAYEQWLQQAGLDEQGTVVMQQPAPIPSDTRQPTTPLFPMVMQLMPMVVAEFYQAYFELSGLRVIELLYRFKYAPHHDDMPSLVRTLRESIKKFRDINAQVNALQLPPEGQVIAQRMTYHTARLSDLVYYHLDTQGYYDLYDEPGR